MRCWSNDLTELCLDHLGRHRDSESGQQLSKTKIGNSGRLDLIFASSPDCSVCLNGSDRSGASLSRSHRMSLQKLAQIVGILSSSSISLVTSSGLPTGWRLLPPETSTTMSPLPSSRLLRFDPNDGAAGDTSTTSSWRSRGISVPRITRAPFRLSLTRFIGTPPSSYVVLYDCAQWGHVASPPGPGPTPNPPAARPRAPG